MNTKEILKLKERIYQEYYSQDTSRKLFNSAWKQYHIWLKDSIYEPFDDKEITDWVNNIILDIVSNPYYISGQYCS